MLIAERLLSIYPRWILQVSKNSFTVQSQLTIQFKC